MKELGCPEGRGLLFRPEYDIALESLDENQDSAEEHRCGGTVVTGQLGIGKTCFLYYLLLCKLSKKTPVALQLPNHILVFRDDGVLRYPLTADPHEFPEGTWALSDSNDRAKQPCNTFLGASNLRQAWIVQTSPPLEERWKTWSKYHNANMFVMDHFSIQEITALGKVLDLDVGNIRRLYEQWGPSVRTCVRLSLNPGDEILHEENIEHAAVEFVKTAPKTVWFDAMRVSHLLLSIRPSDKTMVGRMIRDPDMATDRIKTMISYAAAASEAEDRDKFFHTITKYSWMDYPPDFRAAGVQIFKIFVLSWLSAGPNMVPLDCCPAVPGPPDLQIPACGKKQTTYFSSLTALKEVEVDNLPLCLLPTPQTPIAVDAIIFTDKFIITIQVTIHYKHSVKGCDLAYITESIPPGVRKDRDWCHVFVTNNDNRAYSLRRHTLGGLPENIRVFSTVFDVCRSDIAVENIKAFDENRAKLGLMAPQATIGVAVLSEKRNRKFLAPGQ
ncbi:hypothetical protein EDB86DRAFT_2373479 [Lactarius hatsudake]|nr:hypothetical protein EDB86DRAFT_2373479 [Lactarius hatsudake]